MKELVAGVALIAVTLFGVVAVPRTVKHYYRSEVCKSFAVQTGRETKFADYTWWNFECLVKTSDGRWVPKDALREVNP